MNKSLINTITSGVVVFKPPPEATSGLARMLDYSKMVPGQSVEVYLMIDATGSMERIWFESKKCITELMDRLLKVIPEIKLGLIAYRDYKDVKLLEVVEPSNKSDLLLKFINSVKCYGGDDYPEAVEVALGEILRLKAVFGILIGDAPPHGAIDEVIRDDYRVICKKLAQTNKKIYTIALQKRMDLKRAFKEISSITGGVSYDLDNWHELIDYLSITVAKEFNKTNELITVLKDKQGQLTPIQKELLLLT